MHQKEIPILMYHSIQSEPKGAILRGLSVPVRLFKLQMFILKLFGYKGLCMTDLLPYLSGSKTGKVFGLTFDDGYLNNYTNALNILKKYNFSATCYIVAGNIGGTNFWDLKKGVSEKTMMNKQQISQWIDNGMEIGSHSYSHIRLSSCSSSKLHKEIFMSKKKLEREFKVPINHFCYPYGDYSQETIDQIRLAGYSSATTVIRGKVKPGSSLFELPRVLINHRTFPHLLLLKIFGSYENRR